MRFSLTRSSRRVLRAKVELLVELAQVCHSLQQEIAERVRIAGEMSGPELKTRKIECDMAAPGAMAEGRVPTDKGE